MPCEIHNCNECGAKITECVCEESHTCETCYGPACPHCGLLNLASESDDMLYRAGERKWECDHCGKEFTVMISISYTWEAKKQ